MLHLHAGLNIIAEYDKFTEDSAVTCTGANMAVEFQSGISNAQN